MKTAAIAAFETLWQDVRYAIRAFRQAPLFPATVIATIAIGLGVNTAAFTMFNAYVLRPFAVRDPYSLYAFAWQPRTGTPQLLTWPEFEALRRDTAVFSEVFAERRRPLITRVEGHTAYVHRVSGNYFHMLGIDAALGRVLEPDDTAAPGRRAVAVLNYDFWQRVFSSDPAIVGRTIVVHGRPCEIVGVARIGFGGLDASIPRDIWVPITLDGDLVDDPSLFGPDHPRAVGVVGRLRAEITIGSANAGLLAWSRAVISEVGDRAPAAVILESRATSIALSPATLAALTPAIAGFVLVLLIACANVANLMLARGLARQREIGIRLTLGASRARLVRQLLTESILLSAPAAAVGFGISRAAIDIGVRAMLRTVPSEFAEYVRIAPLPPDVRVFLFMLLAAVATGVLFGLAPAVQATRPRIVSFARGDFGSDFGPARLRRVLVIVQVAAAILLLITASVLVQSVRRVASIDAGIRTRDIVTLHIREQARPRIAAALAASRLVLDVAAASSVPFLGAAPQVGVRCGDRPEVVTLRYRYVSPSYFPLLDIPITHGRSFTSAEAQSGAPVAIVSQSAAAQLCPGVGDAILGRGLSVVLNPGINSGARIARYATVTVIGVARDTLVDLGPNGPMPAAIHLPLAMTASGSDLIVRVAGDARAARRTLDETLTLVAPGAVQEIHTFQDVVTGRVYPFQVLSWISGLVGLLALLLTISGIYGVLSYLVAQRAKDISIRIAVGATLTDIASLVMRQSAGLAAGGLFIGTLLALASGRAIASNLIMIDVFDPVAYGGGILIVGTAGVLASVVPALRAARVDPITTLRSD